MKHTGNSVNVVALALHNLSILPLPGPGLTAHNAAYVAPRAAIGKTANSELTFHLDHSMGADQFGIPSCTLAGRALTGQISSVKRSSALRYFDNCCCRSSRCDGNSGAWICWHGRVRGLVHLGHGWDSSLFNKGRFVWRFIEDQADLWCPDIDWMRCRFGVYR